MKGLIDRVYQESLIEKMYPVDQLALLGKAVRVKEANGCEVDPAHRALLENHLEDGSRNLERTVTDRSEIDAPALRELFFTALLDFPSSVFP